MISEKAKIYGIDNVGCYDERLITRTDASEGLGYKLGESEIESDFDKCFPWCEMREVVDEYGNVFIRIPKFYAKITKNSDGTYKHQISGYRYDGFETLFVDGKGNEIDYVLVGKYEGSCDDSGYMKSVSGATVKVNITINECRNLCRNNGKGYQQYDFLIDAIIKELFMIEFATTNSKEIIRGYTNGANLAALSTGRTDDVQTQSGSPTSNKSGKYACKYRGIENPWGNVWTFVDGINFKEEKIYVCTDPEYYETEYYYPPYTYVGDRCMESGSLSNVSYFSKIPLLCYATESNAANAGECYASYYYVNNKGIICTCGGSWTSGAFAGPWYWYGMYNSLSSSHNMGGRLCFKPPLP